MGEITFAALVLLLRSGKEWGALPVISTGRTAGGCVLLLAAA